MRIKNILISIVSFIGIVAFAIPAFATYVTSQGGTGFFQSIPGDFLAGGPTTEWIQEPISTIGSTTYVTYPYASGTYLTMASASSSFPTFTYASSTYYFASNPANYISLASLSSLYPIMYNNATGVFSSGFTTSTNNIFSNLNTFNATSTLSTTSITSLSLGDGLINSLLYANSSGQIIASSTSGFLAGYVPYVGATTAVNLGNNNLTDTATTTLATTSVNNLLIGTNVSWAVKNNDIAPILLQGSSSGALEEVIQNTSNTPTSSADFVVTANNGTDLNYYGDFGINNNPELDQSFTIATSDDVYAYASDGNLILDSATTSGSIKFGTGGSLAANQRMTITSGGNVDIATTTGSTILNVVGTTTTTHLNIFPLTSSFIAVDPNGNVIATTSPSGGGVSGGTNGYEARFTSPTAVTAGMLIDNGTVLGVNASSSGTTFNLQGNAGTSIPFNVASSSGTSYFNVIQNGDVGIGTTTPSSLLSIQGTAGSSNILFVISSSTVSTSSPQSRAFSVQPNGNVGIGTTTSVVPLTVVNDNNTNGEALLLTGRSSDGTIDYGNGVVLDIGHNSSGNRQFVLADSASGAGVRFLGSAIDGYNFTGGGSRQSLAVGNNSTQTMFPDAFGSNGDVTIDGDGQTASHDVVDIRGNTGLTGNYLAITPDPSAAATFGSIFNINSTGEVSVGSSTPNAWFTVQGSSSAPTVDLLDVASSTTSGTKSTTTVVFRINQNGSTMIGTSTNPNAYALIIASTTASLSGTNGQYPLDYDNANGVSQLVFRGSETPGGGKWAFGFIGSQFNSLTGLESDGSGGETLISQKGISFQFGNNTSVLNVPAPIDVTNSNNVTGQAVLLLNAGTTQSTDFVDLASSTGPLIDVINKSGYVGISSSTPGSLLSIQGTSTQATKNPLTVASSSGAIDMTILPNGDTGIATNSPATALDVDGDITDEAAAPIVGTGANTAIACYLTNGKLGYITITSLLASGNCNAN
jgi:hypothetical protein